MMTIRSSPRASMWITLVAFSLLCTAAVFGPSLAESPSSGQKGTTDGDAKSSASTSKTKGDDGTATADLNALSLQVEALKALYAFDVQPNQLTALASLAQGAAAKMEKRPNVKVNEKLTKALADLRDALLKPYDSDLIDTLTAKLDDAREAEDADLDEEADITDVARERASQAARVFNIRQVIRFTSLADNSVTDPLERIRDTIKNGRDRKPEEVSDLNALTAEDVGWLVAGLAPKKAAKVQDQVAELLKKAQSLKPEEFKAQEAELVNAARQIIGKVSYADVLRHYTQYSLAELLSNPQFEAAINARLRTLPK